ncbi:hypothetical protein LUZ60_006886 [Juncus effusus]|nr:hypothetical protein LUZ60_006886 [Juncus effusus]
MAVASNGGCSAGDLFTGERAVVLLFVIRVALAVPSSLFFPHAATLLLLFLAALFVEISVEKSSDSSSLLRFKTRPGVSSGILLGATTLPAVMLSRLIQLSRVSLSHNNAFGYLEMQYWIALACCFGVIMYFIYLMKLSEKNWRSPVLCVVACVFMCYLLFALKSNEGFYASKMLYLIFHGAATVILIQHVLIKFPFCASIGEALLVSSGMVLYFGDLISHSLAKMNNLFSLSSKLDYFPNGNHSEIYTIIQGELLGLLLLPIFYKNALKLWDYFRNMTKRSAKKDERFRKIESSVLFSALILIILAVLVPIWMHFVQDFHTHPLFWVLNFVFTNPLERLALCSYWICIIFISVLRFYNISKKSKTERILLRKYYHLVAVLMFVPALIFQADFLDLAFGAALIVFLILEMIRVWEIWPLGKMVHQFMNAFTDHRDSEILIVSHFSLLLGCALPKWVSLGFNDRPLAPFAGILSLGIGDTMASMVGHKYGVLRWSKTGKKTVEGTAAGITSVWAACYTLLPLLASSGFILSQHWGSLLIAVTLSGLLEAYTAQLDNAFIPLVFYSLLCL